MKIKLKEGQSLSYNNNHSGLSIEDWTALNQKRVIEIDSIPDLIKDKVEKVKKGGK